jgi:hypothetical protein
MQIPLGLKSPLVLAAALLLGSASAASAADPADVATVLAQMRQASGGDAWTPIRALHSVTNSVSGGEVTLREHWEDVVSGRYAVSAAGTGGPTQIGFDGVTTWCRGRSGIPYTLGDVDSGLVAADESFRVARAWWFRDRHDATIARLGVRSENGRSFDVLSVTPEGGRAFEAWIDRSTHLLARTDEQQAEDRVVTSYADYRAVKGVMIPFTVRTGDGNDARFDAVETVQSVEINPAIPDTRYAIPALPPSDIQFPAGRDSIDVPFRLAPNNRILVQVTFNGRVTVDAEFDSGGSLLLQPASVSKLGAATEGRHKQSGGGEGSTTSTAGRLDSFQIGGARVSELPFQIMSRAVV